MTEGEIEMVARAICEGHGFDPEDKVMDDDGWRVPRWNRLRSQAISHIAAYKECVRLYGEITDTDLR